MIDYLIIAIIIAVFFVIGWITICLMVEGLLQAMFNYNFKMAEKCMEKENWNSAQVYNERLSSICKWMARVDRVMFLFFWHADT